MDNQTFRKKAKALTNSEFDVYGYLLEKGCNKWHFFTNKDIAKELEVNPRTVSLSIKKLKSLKYIKVRIKLEGLKREIFVIDNE